MSKPKRNTAAAPVTTPQRAVPAALDPSVLAIMANVEQLAVQEVSGERAVIKMQTPGDFVVARLVEIKEAVNFDGRIYYLDGPNADTDESDKVVLVGSTDLDSKIRGPLVGRVLGLFLTDLADTGKSDPMKVFRVFDLGDDFPALASYGKLATVESDELPF